MKPGHMLVFIDKAIQYGKPLVREDVFPCTRDMIVRGLSHQRFYVIDRAIREFVGPWPVAMINGEKRLIDGSVPTHLDRIPRDAVEITGELAESILHNQDGHHAWACCFVPQIEQLLTVCKAQRT